MNLTHNGKIGRLPEAIREEVNVRLRKGEKGRVVVEWLNGLPEVRAVMAAEFGGKPVREQNLSEWRKGGHQQWLLSLETKELAEHMCREKGLTELSPGKLLDAMVTHVTVRYLLTLKRLQERGADDREKFAQLQVAVRDVVALQRAEVSAGRLELDWDKLAFGREKLRGELFMYLADRRGQEATKAPSVQDPSSKEAQSIKHQGMTKPVTGTNQMTEGEEKPSKQSRDANIQHSTPNIQPSNKIEEEEEHEEDQLVIRVNPGDSDRGIIKNKFELRPCIGGGVRQPGVTGSRGFELGGKRRPEISSRAILRELSSSPRFLSGRHPPSSDFDATRGCRPPPSPMSPPRARMPDTTFVDLIAYPNQILNWAHSGCTMPS